MSGIDAHIKGKAIMAPMAGFNTPAFYRVLLECGCETAYTELLTSHGLIHKNSKTIGNIDSIPDGMVYAGQIFGGMPDIMAEAAKVLQSTGRFAWIDINMGCPVPKVVKGKGGAALMREPELAASIIRSVVAAVSLPVTVKIRSGWSASETNCVEFAKMCEGEGAAAVALHPRTRVQGYSGSADWSLVAETKRNVSIPVIGSGDLDTHEKAVRLMRESGCDGVMIGRAACSDPRIIHRVQKAIDGLDPGPPTDHPDRIDLAIRHLRLLSEYKGSRAVIIFRTHLALYLKGMSCASRIRAAANKCDDIEDAVLILSEFRDQLRASGSV